MTIRRLLLLSAWLIVAGRGASPAAADGPISGRVLDPGGEPVAGARIELLAYRSPEEQLLDQGAGSEPRPVTQTRTDARGSFQVSMAKMEEPAALRVLADGLPAVEIPGPIEAGGEEELEILIPSGQVMTGRVTDEAGKPVTQARVFAWAALELPEDGVAFGEARTGRDGSFVLPQAPSGDITLRIWAPGLAPLAVRSSRAGQRFVLKSGGELVGAVADPSRKVIAAAIVTAGGEAVRTDASGQYRFVALPEGLLSVEALWQDGRLARRDGVRIRKGAMTRADLVMAAAPGISGVVVDEKTRRPLSRARVAVVTSRFTAAGTPPVREERTDSRGRFHLVGLASREYHLTVSRAGYLPSGLPVTAGMPPPEIHVALVRGATVSGKVTDEKGVAVAGVRVQMSPGTGRRAMFYADPVRGAPSSISRADGSFRLGGLPPGIPVSILATREGFVSTRRDGIATAAGAGKPVTLVLRRGLEARGRVVNGEGEAIVGAQVALSRTEERRLLGGAGWSTESPGSARSAVTSADGGFVLKALEAGSYSAAIKHAAYASKSIAALEVKASGTTDWGPFVLTPSAPLSGLVRNKRGEPVAGGTVATSSSDGGYNQVLTDAEGRFRQDGYSAGAAVSLSVRAEGYAETKQSVKAPASDLAIVLSTSGTIRGRVEDGGTREPVSSFSIRGRIPRSPYIEARDFRSDDGGFEISDIPPGKVDLTASAPGFLEGRAAGIEVGEGEVKEGVVLSLKKGQRISGRVLDPSRGAGVPNATVSWRRVSERTGEGILIGPGGAVVMVANPATTDADGRFEYDAVPPEKLIFKATHPDFLEAEKPIDASAESEVSITLSQGGSIEGAVIRADGRSPVPGAEVSLAESGGAPSVLSGDETRADEGGRFSFLHLKEGRYRLTAQGTSGRSGATEVVISQGQSTEGVILSLDAGAVLRGRVTGLPPERLAGLEVHAYSDGLAGSAATGSDGQFALANVPSGVVLVAVSMARSGASTRSVTKKVDVPEGASEVPVDVDFSGASRLVVRLTRKERPLPGVGLLAQPDLGAPGSSVGGETDADGRAVLEGLEDATYLLTGRSQGASVFQRVVTVSGDSAVEIALGRGSMSGIVSDASSGEPLSDVAVGAESGQEATAWQVRRSLTDSQGSYTIDELEPGAYQVTARKDGYRQKTLAATLDDSPAELNFKLSWGGGLTIVATDGLTGLPLSALSALAFSDTGAIAFSGAVALDATGSGEIASLAPGRYAVYVNSAGYAPRSINPVQVPSPQVAVSLTPGGRLEIRAASAGVGRILDAAGAPYLFSIGSLDGRLSLSPPVSALDHIAPGSYRLVVEGPDRERAYPFSIAEGQTTRLETP
jgi:5-hydroxyisourate hydrolase-like protein (transthyretin family)